MSRTQIYRKIKALTGKSPSVYLRSLRLSKAKQMIKRGEGTISEISYRVGFGSSSYFIKCFRDYYGYPPGEAGNRDITEEHSGIMDQTLKKRLIVITGISLSIVLFAFLLYFLIKQDSRRHKELEKSIAVLPFRNESNDSANVYIVNGLMESLLTYLQQIEDLRVISRTSVEKYRKHSNASSSLAYSSTFSVPNMFDITNVLESRIELSTM